MEPVHESTAPIRHHHGIEHELELAARRHRLYRGTVEQLMMRAADEIARLRKALGS